MLGKYINVSKIINEYSLEWLLVSHGHPDVVKQKLKQLFLFLFLYFIPDQMFL